MSRLTEFSQRLFGPAPRLEHPVVLQFPVNDICNSRCQMCHIWQKKQKHPVSIEQLRSGLANPLFAKIRTVGLNGGEPTLRRDLAQVASALFETLPELQSINLITNAINDAQVIERIDDLSQVVRGAGGFLDVMVSVDGYEAVHDAVRGREGNFASAVRVLDWLANSGKADNVRIGCTVIRENVYGLHELHRFCRDRSHYVKYRLGIPHKRLYTDAVAEPFHLTEAERIHFTTFLEGIVKHYEPDARQRQFYRSLIGQMRENRPRSSGCDWKHRGATLTSRGEVLYCAVESPVIADLASEALLNDYFAGSAVLDKIRSTKCSDCHHDYVGIPEAKESRKLLLETLIDRSGQRDNLMSLWRGFGLRDLRQKQSFAKDVAATQAKSIVFDTSRPASFLICGWYGTETLGDKAILGAVVQGLRDVEPDTPITLASLDPLYSNLTISQMPDLANVEVVSMDEARLHAATARAVIMGGGPMMHINEIILIRQLFKIADDHGQKTVIAGCGVGPLDTARHRRVVADILQISNLNIFRDEASARKAEQIAGKIASPYVTTDPAFAWLEAQQITRSSQDRHGLLLGLRAFPAEEYAPKLGIQAARMLQQDLDHAIAVALAEITARDPELRLRPIPMCTNSAGADDRFYYDSLFRLHDGLKDRVDWSLLSRELDPSEYLEVFRTSKAALAMRFHAVVFALQAGLSTVAIDYTLGRGKVGHLAARAGIPCHRPDSIDAKEVAHDLAVALVSGDGAGRVIDDTFAATFKSGMARLLKEP